MLFENWKSQSEIETRFWNQKYKYKKKNILEYLIIDKIIIDNLLLFFFLYIN